MTRRGPRSGNRGDKIARQYVKGATMAELAGKHGISKAAVSKIIKRRGLSPSFEEWRRRVKLGGPQPRKPDYLELAPPPKRRGRKAVA